ncbi:hypothetical protein D3C78_1976400 [compost metagenome]
MERLRVEAARPLVEAGWQTLEEVARLNGFINTGRMHQSFLRVVGRSPLELRRSARTEELVRHERQSPLKLTN